jgi:hypothetical protein
MIEQLNDSTYLDMVEIPAGSFLMGSPPEEEGRYDDEGPQHEVTLGAFFMSRTPVTQAQWHAVASLPKVSRDLELNPSYFRGDDLPVERVSWHDCIEFCQRLSQHTGRDYTLPSESQWEYACRAGTITRFHFGDEITTKQVNFDGEDYRGKTTDVGSFAANAWGLYDMHGNVWEWCLDDWHDSYEGAPSDGSAWVEGRLGKPCAAARGTSAPGTADRPSASGSTRTPAAIALGSVSVAAENNSLGKPSGAARGATTPGIAAQPSAAGTYRTASATLASVSVVFLMIKTVCLSCPFRVESVMVYDADAMEALRNGCIPSCHQIVGIERIFDNLIPGNAVCNGYIAWNCGDVNFSAPNN